MHIPLHGASNVKYTYFGHGFRADPGSPQIRRGVGVEEGCITYSIWSIRFCWVTGTDSVALGQVTFLVFFSCRLWDHTTQKNLYKNSSRKKRSRCVVFARSLKQRHFFAICFCWWTVAYTRFRQIKFWCKIKALHMVYDAMYGWIALETILVLFQSMLRALPYSLLFKLLLTVVYSCTVECGE